MRSRNPFRSPWRVAWLIACFPAVALVTAFVLYLPGVVAPQGPPVAYEVTR